MTAIHDKKRPSSSQGQAFDSCGTTLIAVFNNGHLIEMPTHFLPCNVSARHRILRFPFTEPSGVHLSGPFPAGLPATPALCEFVTSFISPSTV